MKKMKNIFKLLTATFLLLISCDDKLNLEPFQSIGDEIALSTSESVEFVLNGAYDRASSTDALAGQMLLYTDLLGSDGVLSFFGTFDFLQDMSLKEVLFNNSGANVTWIRAYSVINQANIVLSAQDVLDSSIKDRVVGEALFLRAVMHFNLALLYAKPYSAGSTNLGIIIRTEPKAADATIECQQRGTLADNFTSIINDLNQAVNLLPINNTVYANKIAAYGILSRVYLQMEDYPKALTAANNAISQGAYVLENTYSTAFARENNNSSEDIFAIQVSQGDGSNGMYTFYAPASQGGRGDVRFSSGFIAKFAPGDQRRNMIDANGFSRKWFNQFGNVNYLRLAELYLTRAECNFRLGSAIGDTHVNDYNRVHQRAGLNPVGNITLNDILEERTFELFSEGQYFYDQLRLKNSIGNFSFDSDKLVLPIPTSYTVACPDVVQNPGYSN